MIKHLLSFTATGEATKIISGSLTLLSDSDRGRGRVHASSVTDKALVGSGLFHSGAGQREHVPSHLGNTGLVGQEDTVVVPLYGWGGQSSEGAADDNCGTSKIVEQV